MRLFPCLLLFALPAVAAAPGEVTEELVLQHHSAAEVAGWFSPQPHRDYALNLPAGVTAVRGEDYSSVLTVTGEADGVALLGEVIARFDAAPRRAVIDWTVLDLTVAQAEAAGVAVGLTPTMVDAASVRARLAELRAAPPVGGGSLTIAAGAPHSLGSFGPPTTTVSAAIGGDRVAVLAVVERRQVAPDGRVSERRSESSVWLSHGAAAVLPLTDQPADGRFLLIEARLLDPEPPAALSRLAREWIEREIRRLGRLTVRHLDPDDVENLRLALTRGTAVATFGAVPTW